MLAGAAAAAPLDGVRTALPERIAPNGWLEAGVSRVNRSIDFSDPEDDPVLAPRSANGDYRDVQVSGAWRLRDVLQLDRAERIATRGSLRGHLMSIGIGGLSLALALLVPAIPALSGLIYFLMGPVQGINGYLTGQRVARAAESDDTARLAREAAEIKDQDPESGRPSLSGS